MLYTMINRDVEVGETLLIEEPIVAAMTPEMMGSHCHHCFSLIQVTIYSANSKLNVNFRPMYLALNAFRWSFAHTFAGIKL